MVYKIHGINEIITTICNREFDSPSITFTYKANNGLQGVTLPTSTPTVLTHLTKEALQGLTVHVV